jgi:hypothetical protein
VLWEHSYAGHVNLIKWVRGIAQRNSSTCVSQKGLYLGNNCPHGDHLQPAGHKAQCLGGLGSSKPLYLAVQAVFPRSIDPRSS